MTKKYRISWFRQTTSEDGFYIYRSESPMSLGDLPDPIVNLPPGSSFWEDPETFTQPMYYRVGVHKNGVVTVSDEQTNSTLALGPGPQSLLMTNPNEGYFGQTSSADLMTQIEFGQKVQPQSPLTNINSTYNTGGWLKVYIDRKILYICKYPFRTVGNGRSLSSFGAHNGDLIINAKGYAFKVRLLKGLADDAEFPTANGTDLVQTHGSEWNRLMYNLCNYGPVPASQVGVKWDTTLTAANLGITSIYDKYITMETLPSGSHLTRGSSNTPATINIDTNASSAVWRPVLELVSN